jgi:hypothetical protein
VENSEENSCYVQVSEMGRGKSNTSNGTSVRAMVGSLAKRL